MLHFRLVIKSSSKQKRKAIELGAYAIVDKPCNFRELVVKVKDTLYADGMLITVSGPHGNVLRLQPSLCVTSKELDTFVASLQKALGSVRDQA